MAIEQHPVYREPTVQEVVRFAEHKKVSVKEGWKLLHAKRVERIRQERVNPLVYGWEPSVWRVCRALLGLDWSIPEFYGKDYGPRMRAFLGFKEPVAMLLVNGGNRASKSEMMAKMSMQCLLRFQQAALWAFHTDGDMSREYQQPLFWKYMPPEYRGKAVMSQTTYIAYKMKTGFSEGNFILPNESLCSFRNYAQEKTKIEGGELGNPKGGGDVVDGLYTGRCLGAVADELIPSDWVETLALRLATRSAAMCIGFTPVAGYTDTVKLFQDGAEVVRWSTGWMLPRDGGKVSQRCLEVEDCDAWIAERPPDVQRVDESGREYELVPRVMRCKDARRAVVFFHTSDNPYGNPREVMAGLASRDTRFKRERFYGVADKQIAGRFPLFMPRVHVVKPEAIPARGTNYLIVDPCDGRNWFMLWVRACEDGKVFVVDEWPSMVDPVPGYGILGEWAVTTGDSKRLDGRMGPGQSCLGWGLLQYKAEIARVEGWECWKDGARPEEIAKWDEHGKARVRVQRRFLDARMGNVNSLQEDGVRSLFEECDSIGLTFEETSAHTRNTIDEGVQMINTALYFNKDAPLVQMLNEPRLYVSDRCENVIFALQVWTGVDGQKGATKDPIDCLRYFFLKDCRFVEENGVGGVVGAGCY